jgi:Fe-S-cluster containining protein
MGVFLDDNEAEKLAALAGARCIVLHFREVAERRAPRHRAGWLLRFADHAAGVCPFLNTLSNECSIYAHRPEACRRFPTAPTANCLVWPKS